MRIKLLDDCGCVVDLAQCRIEISSEFELVSYPPGKQGRMISMLPDEHLNTIKLFLALFGIIVIQAMALVLKPDPRDDSYPLCMRLI